MSTQASYDLWHLWKCHDSFKRALEEQAEWLTGRLYPLENPKDNVEIAELPQRQDDLSWTEIQRCWSRYNNSSASFQHTPHAWRRKGMRTNHPLRLLAPWNLNWLWSVSPCFPFFSPLPPTPKGIGGQLLRPTLHWPRKTFCVGRVRIHNPSTDSQPQRLLHSF